MIERTGLQATEIADLWLEYHRQRRPEIREKLIANYLSLVKLVAGRIAVGLPMHIDKDDLVSNGFFGLLDAIERFDPLRNIKFETYAVSRIRGSILDSLRAQDWAPISVRQKAKKYEQTLATLEAQLGRSATDEEVAKTLEISLDQLYSMLAQLNAAAIIPLDEFIKDESLTNSTISPLQYVEDEAVKTTLAEAIDALPEKERIIVSLYYYDGLTLKEISLVLKLTEARISQLHTKAILRLRGALTRIQSSLI
ncbi:RNA polymerase subunit sigma [Anaerosporomusa subterranea]|uniref:RNA polymerase sigma factor n=1 Tax=Anaerosporomusa subterranea TaxID=1794912 RepID=A0A154BTX5_ANASB|nr:FliA/WhiG family RNA polymerase sigma factor [Anaerosporomusa subterranea]KYZ77270.1 RNA polymerase subunit sigma [Anaerosporomusa subterranea]